MDRYKDMEQPGLVDEMSEEMERSMRLERPYRRGKGEQGMDPQKKSLILSAIGAVILIILLMIFFGGGDKSSSKELTALKSRIDGLEKRLTQLDKVDQKISAAETQIKGLQGSLARLEGASKSLREQVEKANQRVEELIKKEASAPSVPPKAQTPAASPQKKAATQGEKILHEVQPKETLFGIAKKYNLKVDELRRLNKLSKEDAIQPGQKLLVKSTSP